MTTVFCVCRVYGGKPHQVGRGKCTGSSWVYSLFCLGNKLCEDCSFCSNDGVCEIVEGRESVEYCPIYQEAEKGFYPAGFHPMADSEKFRTKLIEDSERQYQEYSFDDVPF